MKLPDIYLITDVHNEDGLKKRDDGDTHLNPPQPCISVHPEDIVPVQTMVKPMRFEIQDIFKIHNSIYGIV